MGSIAKGYSNKVVPNASQYYREKKGFISACATILVQNHYTVGPDAGMTMLWEWIYLESYPNVVWRSIRVPSNVDFYNPSWPAVPFIKCGDFIDLHRRHSDVVYVSKKRKKNMFFDDILEEKLGGERTLLGD